MLLAMCYLSKRSAMGDLYKNLLNELPHKNEIIIIIPRCYQKEEFSKEFFKIIQEDFFIKSSKIKKIKKMYQFFLMINKYIKKYNISNIYMHNEYWLFNSLIYLLNRKLKYTLWFHDPVLHEGTGKIEQFKRWMSYYLYIRHLKHLIVSYKGAMNIYNKKINKLKSKFVVLYLPQMPELEYESIKNNKNNRIEYDFIFYGRIEKYKGLDLLLEVFNDKDLKNIKLLIVGRGKEDKSIKAICNGKKNITFINDYVDNETLAKYIVMSKYVILPYQSATGTQTVQIANYYQKLVLATKVGCFSEYIVEGENGFFIEGYTYSELKRAILTINDKEINRYKEKIYKVYMKFNISRIVNSLYKII